MKRSFLCLLPAILATVIFVAGCSVPEYYIDIHYQKVASLAEPLNIEIFISNARYGTEVLVESIYLVGNLAFISKPWPNREGAYIKQPENGFISAILWRKLSAFETGCFSITLKLSAKGTYKGMLTFYIDKNKVEKGIEVEVTD